MRATPPYPGQGGPEPSAPRCVFVTGPRGAGKTRWLLGQIRNIEGSQPGARCAVLLAEEGRTRIGGTAPGARGTAVRRLLLPCPCCAALADLPGALSELAAIARPATIFVEVPAVAASGLLAEFDRVLGWPREVAVCLDRAWANAMRERELSPFHTALLDIADHVVPGPASGETPAAPPIHNDAA